MRKIVVALLGTVSGVVMLFSYHTSLAGSLAVPASTGVSTTTSGGGVASGGTPSGGGSSSRRSSGTGSSGSSGGTGGGTGSAASGTVTGDTADTQWGPVQVQITVANGKITDVTAVQYPNGNGRDAMINSYALPVLFQETVAAQSAHIDLVSGATVTSDGYVQSLQSAIDKAHL